VDRPPCYRTHRAGRMRRNPGLHRRRTSRGLGRRLRVPRLVSGRQHGERGPGHRRRQHHAPPGQWHHRGDDRRASGRGRPVPTVRQGAATADRWPSASRRERAPGGVLRAVRARRQRSRSGIRVSPSSDRVAPASSALQFTSSPERSPAGLGRVRRHTPGGTRWPARSTPCPGPACPCRLRRLQCRDGDL